MSDSFMPLNITVTAGDALAFFKMHAAYAHLTKKCVRAAKMCVSVYYRSNYHLGQKHEQQQQIQARVQTYSLNQLFPAIAALVELDSSSYQTWTGFVVLRTNYAKAL